MAANNPLTRVPRQVMVTTLVALIAIPSLLCAQEGPKPPNSDALVISLQDRLTVFEKLWNTLNSEYFDPNFNGVDWAHVKEVYRPQVEAAKNKMELWAVLQRMVGELHTSHLGVSLNLKVKREQVEQDLSRTANRKERLIFGAGLNFVRVEGQQVIHSVADGSGAQAAGVQRGWILTHWNGESYTAATDTACELGETLKLRFLDAQRQERNLDVVCKLYSLGNGPPERTAEPLDDGVVYLHFREFASGTANWLSEQVSRNHSASAIVIDLRRNTGGLLSELRKSFEPFFSSQTIFGESRQRNGKEPTLKVSGRGREAYAGRIIVLIDEMSASAAEIFAAGMQESGRGVIVGRQSSGEVLNNYQHGLPNGFRASIPFRDYQTAKGVRLEGRGVTPDVPVKLTMKDFLENRDPDMKRLSELLHQPAQ